MSNAVKAIIYSGKTDSVANLARTLIVASAMQPPDAPFYLPMTGGGARALGRYLEWALLIREQHPQRLAALEAAERAAQDALAQMNAASGKAEKLLDRAKALHMNSLLYFFGGAAWFLASLAFWWLA